MFNTFEWWLDWFWGCHCSTACVFYMEGTFLFDMMMSIVFHGRLLWCWNDVINICVFRSKVFRSQEDLCWLKNGLRKAFTSLAVSVLGYILFWWTKNMLCLFSISLTTWTYVGMTNRLNHAHTVGRKNSHSVLNTVTYKKISN